MKKLGIKSIECECGTIHYPDSKYNENKDKKDDTWKQSHVSHNGKKKFEEATFLKIDCPDCGKVAYTVKY